MVSAERRDWSASTTSGKLAAKENGNVGKIED
jgi:hypothetical protein